MGGFGSGRPSSSRLGTVEGHLALDVNCLHPGRCLRTGWSGTWTWTLDGAIVGAIGLRAEADRLNLSYRLSVGGCEAESVTESVLVVRLPCSFGGARPYFICSGIMNSKACGRRVVKLYGAGRYFLCRDCYRLAYTRQRQDFLSRKLRRANKAMERLGGEPAPGTKEAFLPRPKGMWRRTSSGCARRLQKPNWPQQRRPTMARVSGGHKLLTFCHRAAHPHCCVRATSQLQAVTVPELSESR
jgi:hypothetical protein